MRRFSVCLTALLAGCLFKGDDEPTVPGLLISTSPLVSIQGSPNPAISLLGGTSATLGVAFTNEDFGSSRVRMTLTGLNPSSTYLFEISQNGVLDPVITFPLSAQTYPTFNFPAVPVGTLEAIYGLAQGVGVVQDSSLSIVMGQLSSNGTGCAPLETVTLSPSSGVGSGNPTGPYYFDSNAQLVTSKFSDPECNYIFFNVPSGSYVARFFAQFGALQEELTVTAIEGKVSFGLNIP